MTCVSNPVKYLILSSAGLLATLFCFLLMYLLVTGEIHEAPDFEPVKISMKPAWRVPLEKRRVRSKPELVIPAQPPLEEHALALLSRARNLSVESLLPAAGSMAEILKQEVSMFDLLPPIEDLGLMYIVQPVYPFKAVMKEIEGFVVIQFSIRENGTVMNPFVIDSEPRRLFDEAAISAITKFKFHPRMVGGDPVPVVDKRIRFAFELEGYNFKYDDEYNDRYNDRYNDKYDD